MYDMSERAAHRWTELLSDLDFHILAKAPTRGSGDASDPTDHATLRSDPERLAGVLARMSTAHLLFPTWPTVKWDSGPVVPADGLQVEPSLTLRFAAAVQRSMHELTADSLRAERIGDQPFRRLEVDRPEFEIANRRHLTGLFIELLDSWSTVRASSMLTNLTGTDGTPRPQRAGRTDERQISHLVEVLQSDRELAPGILRRLGDLALFRIGTRTAAVGHASVPASAIVAVPGTLPESFRSDVFRDELDELLRSWSEADMLSELGPIWYRMAAGGIKDPTLAGLLNDLADHFDAAVAFLQFVQRRFSLTGAEDIFVFPVQPATRT